MAKVRRGHWGKRSAARRADRIGAGLAVNMALARSSKIIKTDTGFKR
jgi:hypothetical protein